MIRLLAFIFLLVTVNVLKAQNADSLRALVNEEKNPTRKAVLLTELSSSYRYTSPDSTVLYARQASALYRTLKDTAGLSKSDILICYYYYNSGNPDTALQIAQGFINWLQKKPAMLADLALYYSFSGVCCMKLDRKKEALTRFYQALNYAEKAEDHMTMLKAYVNIGWAMMELNQFEEAIQNFRKALDFTAEKKLPQSFSGVALGNMASCFGSLNQTDSAFKYARLAIVSSREAGNLITEANSLFILGNAQVKKGQLNEALSSYLQAQPLREKVGDPFFIVSDQAEISRLYAKLGKTEEGIAIGKKALALAQQNNITAKLPMIYTSLANNYETAKDYAKAASYYKMISDLKDSMYADANPQAIAEMRTRYETEKQDRLIEQQNNKLRMQNYLFAGIAVFILLSGLLLLSWYKRNKLRQETALKTELMRQQEQAIRAVMEAEENERQRIAKDLHDGVGQMMSAAKMNLSAFESELKFDNDEQRHSFEKVINLVDESCREVRTVSHVMMPNALLKNNLGDAIREFTGKLNQKELRISVYTEGLNERLDSNIETMLYRVVQECVNNTIKHAGASTLDISLIRDKDGISGTIEDNGKGFDAGNPELMKGIGMKNISSRIEYLKGTVDVDSAPGRGTVVGLHIPVQGS
jgi:two-component system NarL family sensor kinase